MDAILNSALSWALQGETTAPADPAAGPSGFPIELIIPILIIFILFQLIVRGPARREEQKRRTEVDAMAKGDAVITIGGIHGTVEGYDKTAGTVTVTVAPKITMKFNRSAIATVTPKKGKSSDDKGGQP